MRGLLTTVWAQACTTSLWAQPLSALRASMLSTAPALSRQRAGIRRFWEWLRGNQARPDPQGAEVLGRLENARQLETRLLEELECKNKQLTSYSLQLVQKNELLQEVKAGIHQLKTANPRENARALDGLKRLVETSQQLDENWEDFKRNFEAVHKDFYRMLKAHHPDLTNHEVKLCTLLRLNKNVKEAATIMGISPESVKKARYRLRKKMGLPHQSNLVEHIVYVENHVGLHQHKQSR